MMMLAHPPKAALALGFRRGREFAGTGVQRTRNRPRTLVTEKCTFGCPRNRP
jgi:hypothetical protein